MYRARQIMLFAATLATLLVVSLAGSRHVRQMEPGAARSARAATAGAAR